MSEENEIELSDDIPEDHRSGFVAVVGRPNVGKSTLMNAFLGEKLAIVSPKPQTTRERQIGILTLPEAQIIFVDTPGIHQARTKLGDFMVGSATESISDADLVLFLVDATTKPNKGDQAIADAAGRSGATTIIVLNKSDLLSDSSSTSHEASYQALLPKAETIFISAKKGLNRDELRRLMIDSLPLGPRFYPPDQITETFLKDSAAEMIREKVLGLFDKEVPHAIAVQVEEFKERNEDMTYIAATIYVERESQKGIVIGKKGAMLKKLGQSARGNLEELVGTKVYLELWVKVLKNWRRDERALRRLGYYRGK